MTEIAERTGTDVDLASAPLRDVENYIAPRLRGFVEAGYALMAIRERRLYLDGWDTFEQYCRERWGIEAAHARRMCDAAQVAHITAGSTGVPAGVSVENEAQARELAPLLGKPSELREVWRETVERTNGSVTAAAIRAVRKEHQARQEPPAPRPAPAPKPRPAPVTVVPAAAQRVFLLITQAVEEARALGGPAVFRVDISADVRAAWTAQLAAASGFVDELVEACGET